MEGANITMVDTYPTANAAGITTAAGINAGPTSPDGYDVQGGGAAEGSVLRVMVMGNDPVNCSFTYTAPTGPNQAPLFSILTNTGC
jgi:MSHA pilin protein MshA